jgi:hypothetical protein
MNKHLAKSVREREGEAPVASYAVAERDSEDFH